MLVALLRQFPFRIRGFHSDNGSEFINQTVAKLLNKLLIEQTKSRPRHSHDNGCGDCLRKNEAGWGSWIAPQDLRRDSGHFSRCQEAVDSRKQASCRS